MLRRCCLTVLLTVLASFVFPFHCAGTEKIRRTLIVLWQKDELQQHLWQTNVHCFLQLPLNHLGFKLRYHEISENLPELYEDDDVSAIICAFKSGQHVNDPEDYLLWLFDAVKKGKKLIMTGHCGIGKGSLPLRIVNRFWALFGLHSNGKRISDCQQLELQCTDPAGKFGFELQYPAMKASYADLTVIKPQVKVLLWANNASVGSTTPLICCYRGNSYVAEEYFFTGNYSSASRGFFINPFRLLALLLDSESIPKPDATTLAGCRIYFSQLNGDGWGDETLIARYENMKLTMAQVVMEQVIKPYAQLPVAIGPILEELTGKRPKVRTNAHIARELFALRNVEAASHSYSHILNWNYFNDEGNIEFERDYRYYDKKSLWAAIVRKFSAAGK